MIGIKDMEMPKCCGQCPCVALNFTEKLICPILCDKNVEFYELEQEGRPDNCPLVELENKENN